MRVKNSGLLSAKRVVYGILIVMAVITIASLLRTLCISGTRASFGKETFQTLHFADISEVDFYGYFYPPRMKPIDLVARQMASYRGYEVAYMDSIRPFTSEQQKLLTNYVKEINEEIIHQTAYFKKAPWRFIKVADNIEMGYPHTHGGVIVLTDIFFYYQNIIQTLIHEQVHVLQRLYPQIAKHFVETVLEFTEYKEKPSQRLLDLISISRNNPDIKGLYAWQNRYIPLQVYTSNKPCSIADSKVILYDISKDDIVPAEVPTKSGVPPTEPSEEMKAFNAMFPEDIITQQEHPFEIMAVLIPRILMMNAGKIKDPKEIKELKETYGTHPLWMKAVDWVQTRL